MFCYGRYPVVTCITRYNYIPAKAKFIEHFYRLLILQKKEAETSQHVPEQASVPFWKNLPVPERTGYQQNRYLLLMKLGQVAVPKLILNNKTPSVDAYVHTIQYSQIFCGVSDFQMTPSNSLASVISKEK